MSLPQVKKPYFPTIDGMRALAIIVVILDHALHQSFRDQSWIKLVPSGNYGVYLFFVISGFLITSLLLHEQQTGAKTINLKKFYIRRILRIFPVAYLYILLIIIIGFFLNIGTTTLTITGALLYLRNMPFFKGDWFFAHFWSLSYEEQYYMWYPWFVKKLKANLYYFLWLILLIIIIIKIITYYKFIPNYPLLTLLTGSEGIIIGAIGGVFYNRKSQLLDINIYLSYVVSILSLIGAYILFNNTFGINQKYLNSIVGSFLLLFFLMLNLKEKNNIISKVLCLKPMIHIGILSYSIYIWQQIFTVPDNDTLFKLYGQKIDEAYLSIFNVLRFPINIIAIYLTAYVSYNYYEKYFLKLKSKFN